MGLAQSTQKGGGEQAVITVCLDWALGDGCRFICPHCEQVVDGVFRKLSKAYVALLGQGFYVVGPAHADAIAVAATEGSLRSGMEIVLNDVGGLTVGADTGAGTFPNTVDRSALVTMFAKGQISVAPTNTPLVYWDGPHWPGLQVILFHDGVLPTPQDQRAFLGNYAEFIINQMCEERDRDSGY